MRLWPNLRRGVMILDAIEPVVMAFAVFMVVYLVLAQPHKVDGNSMYPTFHDKELILTDKLSYKLGKPSRGDVVVFHAPEPWKSDFIKRIIGLPGETIMVKNGLVYVNGEQLSEPYLPAGLKTNEKATLREGIPYAIPADRYMVFGDNRNFSSDSREWGAVKTSALVGKALFVYWPIDRIRLIEHEKYNL